MELSNLEKALLCAANAFIAFYGAPKEHGQGTPAAPQRKAPQAATTETSNGIPVCPVHGKEMRFGKYGYHCTKWLGPGPKDYCKVKA